MEIAFTLTGEYARMVEALWVLTSNAVTGPRFDDPSALCRSWIEALLDDDLHEDAAVPN